MSGSLTTLNAILVEPSALQAKLILAELKALDLVQLRVYAKGEEALAAMLTAAPDIVISALYLPDMTGTELVARMRENEALASVGFLLISSETRPQALESVRQSGICAILPKPFTRQQLRAALTTTLDFLQQDSELTDQLDGENLRVLLVDDSTAARNFMRRVLENLGISHFIEAKNGREAAEILAESMVDLVVTDYNMPEMDGGALVAHIRQNSWQQSVPILMVTSEQDNGRLAAVEASGVSGICDKPFEPAVVKRLLQQMLNKR
jgi:two-component system chemotaxis response regulator CheY